MDLEAIVSELNNYLEEHAYLFDGEYYGNPSDIVANYGFGYIDGEQVLLHWITKGDIESSSIPVRELAKMIKSGLTEEKLIKIMNSCE